MMGIVYHANYLLYFEDARTRFLEAIGFPYDHIEQAGYLSPVTHFECDEDRIRLRGVPGRPGSRHREALLHGTEHPLPR